MLLTSSHHCAALSSPTRPPPQSCLLQEKGNYEDSLLKERGWAQPWNNSDKKLTLEHWPPDTHILPRQTRKRKTLMTRSISYFVTVLRRKQTEWEDSGGDEIQYRILQCIPLQRTLEIFLSSSILGPRPKVLVGPSLDQRRR